MRYESIEFTNFRQFKAQKFKFDNKINLVVADNGSGKSTLMAGLIFCLYGTRKLRESNLLKEADNILVNLENFNTKDNEFYNKIVIVSVIVNIDDKKYKITRKLNNKRYLNELERLGDNFTASIIEDCTVEEINNVSKNIVNIDVIHKRVPANIAPLLFFDGERISNIQDVLYDGKKTGKDGFRSEVERILKVTEIENGEKLLKKTLSEIKKDLVIDANSNNLDTLEQNISILEKTIDERIEYDETFNSNLIDIESKIEEIDKKLRVADSVKELQNNRDRLKQEELNLNNEIINGKNTIYGNIMLKGSELSWKLAFKSLYEKIKREDTEYVIRAIEQLAIDDILENDICICGTKVTNQMKIELERIRNFLPPESFESMLKSYIKQYDNLEYEIGLIMDSQESLLAKLHKKSQIKLEIDVIGQQISMDDATDIKQLENTRRTLIEQRNTKNRDIAQNEVQIQISEKKLETLKEEAKKLRQNNKKNQIVNQKIDVVEKAREDIKSIINDRKLNIKIDLEKNVNKIAKSLVRESVTVAIDKNLKPTTTTKTGTSSISTGIEVMLSISYLLGLIETTKTDSQKEDVNLVNFPIVMDGVTATLDRGHIDNMVDMILKSQSQAIFLVNDQTITLLKESIKQRMPDTNIDSNIQHIVRKKDAKVATVEEYNGI